MTWSLCGLIALSGCTTAHVVSDAGSVATDAGADASSEVDASGTGDASLGVDAAYAPGACRWSVGATTQLSDGPGVRLVGGLALVDDGVLVAWWGYGFGTPDDTSERVQRVGFDGARTASITEPLPGPPPATANMPGSIATSGASHAIIAWDEATGCVFRGLAADGAPTGAAATLGPGYCEALAPSGAGFAYLSGPGLGAPGRAFVRVAADGSPIDTHELAAVAIDARAGLAADGTFVLASQDSTSVVRLRRFAADGTPLGAESTLPTEAGTMRAVGPIATNPGFLLVLGVPRFGLAVTLLDAAGTPSAPPSVLPDVRSERGINYALASSHGDVLVAWTDADPDGSVAIRAQALSELGVPRAQPLDVGTFGHASVGPTVPHAIATPEGVLVVYFAQRDPEPMPMELYATLLVCEPI